jgi:hypothetical protein
MAKIERFEDLIAWQKARRLTRAIYEVTLNGAFAKDYGLSGQIHGPLFQSCRILRRALSVVVAASFISSSPLPRRHALKCVRNCMWPWMRVTWTRPHSTCSYSKLRKWLGLWAACAPLCADRKQTEANKRHHLF